MGKSRLPHRGAAAVLGLISLLLSFYCSYRYQATMISCSLAEPKVAAVTVEGNSSSSVDEENPYCAFRRYPPHRHYQIEDPSPYYKQVKYIHGKWPKLIPQYTNATFKVCLQGDHLNPVVAGQLNATLSWPHVDGTNPTVLHIPSRIQSEAPSTAKLLQFVAPNAHYLVSTSSKSNGLCAWNDDSTPRRQWPSSETGFDVPDPANSKLKTSRTDLLLLDKNFRRLAQTTVMLEDDSDGASKTSIELFDDPRLFIHNGAIHIAFTSYRGYQKQLLAPIGFSINEKGEWLAAAKWGEAMISGRGRNIALITNRNTNASPTTETTPKLHALEWIDPVIVVEVDTTTMRQKGQKYSGRRQLKQQHPVFSNTGTRAQPNAFFDSPLQRNQQRRQLQGKPSSHIHGTNGFMLPIIGTNQYLGIGHFHREDPNLPRRSISRYGHHYTHAFFTLSEIETNTTDNNRSFQLTGLSAEFAFAAAHNSQDAHVIQFASGLEYNPFSKQVIVGYGINDCESALTVFDLQTVLNMLQPVTESDKQVIDYMMNVNETTS